MVSGLCAVDASRSGGYTPADGQAWAASLTSMTLPVEDPAVLSDESLARRLHQQDVQALEALYDRYSRVLYSLALKMLADPDAAEEIVQETFLKLWQRPESYIPERGRLLSWLLGITHHRAVDRLRRRRLELRYSSDYRIASPSTPPPPDPEDELLATLRGEAVVRAVSALPEAQRLAVELAYVHGMTQAEIAEALREPLGTIKTRLRLAMQKLRTSLELAEMRSGPP